MLPVHLLCDMACCSRYYVDAKNSPRLVILKALLDSDHAVVRAVVKYLVSVCMCVYACVCVL